MGIIQTPYPSEKISMEGEERDVVGKDICMWLFYGTGWRNGTPTL